jgi:hypothetical protein
VHAIEPRTTAVIASIVSSSARWPAGTAGDRLGDETGSLVAGGDGTDRGSIVHSAGEGTSTAASS